MAASCLQRRTVAVVVNRSRSFHSTSHDQASILFALGALSTSRETAHFNKITRLDRVEHSPSLKLIQTSEVNPYLPSKPAQTRLPVVKVSSSNSTSSTSPTVNAAASNVDLPVPYNDGLTVSESQAVKVGKAILARYSRQQRQLNKALKHAKQREMTAKLQARVAYAAGRREADAKASLLWILVGCTSIVGGGWWLLERTSDDGWTALIQPRRSFQSPAYASAIVEPVSLPTLASAPVQQQAFSSVATRHDPTGVNTVMSKNLEHAEHPALSATRSWKWTSLFWKTE